MKEEKIYCVAHILARKNIKLFKEEKRKLLYIIYIIYIAYFKMSYLRQY